MKSLKTLFIFTACFYFCAFSSFVNGQIYKWTYYFPSWEIVYSMAAEDSCLWAGTDAGLMRINAVTEKKEFYHYLNTGQHLFNIRSIVVDKQNVKWLSALDSTVLKFDGTGWTEFNITELTAGASVTCIAVDSLNNKWVGTSKGLLKYDGAKWIFFNKSNSGLPDNKISSIACDNSGSLWIGTFNSYPEKAAGLIRFDGINWELFNSSNSGLPYNSIDEVKIDSRGNKWLGLHTKGIVKYDGQKWTFYTRSDSGLPDNNFTCISFDADDNLWVGMWGKAARFNGNKWTIHYSPASGTLRSVNSIFAITPDRFGNLWTGIWNKVRKFDGSGWTDYLLSNCELTDNRVYGLTIDPQGNKWIASFDAILKYDGQKWIKFTSSNSTLPDKFFYFITADRSGNKWIGADKGLIKFDDKNWTLYSNSGLSGRSIRSFAIDSSGNKWTGTLNGLVKFDDKVWTVFDTSNSALPSNLIYAVAADQKGNIWAGCYPKDSAAQGGVAKFDGTKWTLYNTSNSGLSSNYITNIAIDRDGNKWVCTNDGGLVRFDDKDWKVFNKQTSGLPDGIYSVTPDASGNLWIVSGKLIKYDGKNITAYDNSNSTLWDPRDIISDVAIDASGDVWISSYRGIHVFHGGTITLTGGKESNGRQAYSYQLKQNYPNPFNPGTTINYSLSRHSRVTIKIFNALGKELTTLVNEDKPAGNYSVYFKADNLASGIYFYQLKTNEAVLTRKMILLQ